MPKVSSDAKLTSTVGWWSSSARCLRLRRTILFPASCSKPRQTSRETHRRHGPPHIAISRLPGMRIFLVFITYKSVEARLESFILSLPYHQTKSLTLPRQPLTLVSRFYGLTPRYRPSTRAAFRRQPRRVRSGAVAAGNAASKRGSQLINHLRWPRFPGPNCLIVDWAISIGRLLNQAGRQYRAARYQAPLRCCLPQVCLNLQKNLLLPLPRSGHTSTITVLPLPVTFTQAIRDSLC